MKVNKYLLIALLYFFVDVVFLFPGLTYTTFLTPLFYIWIKRNGAQNVVLKFVLVALPFMIVHLWNGVDLYYYVRSGLLYFTVYIFCYAIYIFVRDKAMLGYVFKNVIIINFVLVLVAIAAFFTPLVHHFWTFRRLTLGVESFPRLEMFTFEPSHYSMLFAPVALYYLMKLLISPYEIKSAVAYLIMIFLPLGLSFSLGVLGALGFAMLLLCILNFRHLIRRRHFFYTFITSVVLGTIVIGFLFAFYPDNILFYRIENLFTGHDSSGRGRTVGAIKLAWWIAAENSYWFGAGFGQIKVLGNDIIREYYNFDRGDDLVVTIPSVTGETLAVFGIFGLLFKFGAEIWLFIKTRTADNYFREAVFYFVFIYQLTGSHLVNVPEYFLWIIAFTPCCHFFDKPQALSNSVTSNLS